MPAALAHYTFGNLVYNQLNDHTKQVIQRNRSMFDLGTQGPDLLFFYRPWGKNAISEEGHLIHLVTHRSFLSHIFQIRDLSNEPLTAYLLGVCCHYALDRNVHPIVVEYAPTSVEHQFIESSLEYLVRMEYGISKKRYTLLPNRTISLDALHKVYPTITRSELKECAFSIRAANRILSHKWIMKCIDQIVGKKDKFSSLCIPKQLEVQNAKLLLPYFKDAVSDGVSLLNAYFDPSTDSTRFTEITPHDFEGRTD